MTTGQDVTGTGKGGEPDIWEESFNLEGTSCTSGAVYIFFNLPKMLFVLRLYCPI